MRRQPHRRFFVQLSNLLIYCIIIHSNEKNNRQKINLPKILKNLSIFLLISVVIFVKINYTIMCICV